MESTVITSADWSAVITAITNQFSVATVVDVLAVAIGAAIGFVFLWWGVGYAKAKLMGAIRKGRI